jgi:hypothetical protein
MRKLRSKLAAGAAIGGAAVGGAALANAATTSTPSTSSATAPAASHATPPANFPAPGTAAHEDAEKPVTGAAADKAKAAAIKSVGSGTAGEVTTDFTGNGYEVTVTKSDGSKVEVHLNSSFTVMQGPPGGHGPAGGPPPGGARGQAPSGGPGPGSAGGAPPAGYGGSASG